MLVAISILHLRRHVTSVPVCSQVFRLVEGVKGGGRKSVCTVVLGDILVNSTVELFLRVDALGVIEVSGRLLDSLSGLREFRMLLSETGMLV